MYIYKQEGTMFKLFQEQPREPYSTKPTLKEIGINFSEHYAKLICDALNSNQTWSLRLRLAESAMNGLCSSIEPSREVHPKSIANEAFAIADAMISKFNENA